MTTPIVNSSNTPIVEQGINFKKKQQHQSNNDAKLKKMDTKNSCNFFKGKMIEIVEGFSNGLENNSSNAVTNTTQILNKADEMMASQKIQELKQYQDEYNTVLEQYNNSKNKLVDDTVNIMKSIEDANKESNMYSNVYVNSVVNDAKDTYVGCYIDNSSDKAMTGVSPLTGKPVGFDQCKQNAIDNGFKYFGIQNENDCYVSNDLATTQKYGEPVYPIAIWASNTYTKTANYLSMTDEGYLNVYNPSGVVIYQTTGNPTCRNGGRIVPDTASATYGLNCNSKMLYADCPGGQSNGQMYHVPNGNATTLFQQGLIKHATQDSFTMIANEGWDNNIDPAFCCAKYLDINYQCGNDKFVNQSVSPGSSINIDCSAKVASCKFKAELTDNGNFRIIQGTNENSITEIWNSNTSSNATDKLPHPLSIATQGKYGTPFLLPNQTLYSNEWIGSADGSLQLVMQGDGNAVLYKWTKKEMCRTNTAGHMVGIAGETVNAVYELDKQGDPSVMGKVGYLNGIGMINEYPSSMINNDTRTIPEKKQYKMMMDFDSAGNDIRNFEFTDKTECETACNNDTSCGGFVINGAQCILKNVNMYPNSEKQEYIGSGYELHYLIHPPQVNNNESCSKKLIGVDSNTWNDYKKGQSMTSDTTCGLKKKITPQEIESEKLRERLAELADKILETNSNLESLGVQMNYQMGIDKKVLDNNMEQYKKVSKKYNAYTGPGMRNINGIVNDSKITVSSNNSVYILWSILAIVFIIITILLIKK